MNKLFLRNVGDTAFRFRQVWRDALQGARNAVWLFQTSDKQRSSGLVKCRVNRKVVSSAFLGMLGTCLIATTSAASAAELKLGFVNINRILAEAAPAKKAQTKLEKEFASKDGELKKMGKQIRDLQTSLEKETVTLSENERAKKERELANLNRDFQRIQREYTEDLNLRRNEELAAVLERVDKAVNQVGEQEKFDAILREAAYANPRLDITDRVLKALADK